LVTFLGSRVLDAVSAVVRDNTEALRDFDLDLAGNLCSAQRELPWTSVAVALEAEWGAVRSEPDVTGPNLIHRVEGFADFVPRVFAQQTSSSMDRVGWYEALHLPYVMARWTGIRLEIPHPACRPMVADTCGRLVFQDQVMMLAHGLAGLDLWEADRMRRALVRKKLQDVDSWHDRFVQGVQSICRASERGAETIWEWFYGRDEYCIDRGHFAAEAALVLWIMRRVDSLNPSQRRQFRTGLEEAGLWVDAAV